MRKKSYKLGSGKYYFQVRNGQQQITIFRNDKSAALNAFEKYNELGKDCEWLGFWDGKSFIEK